MVFGRKISLWNNKKAPMVPLNEYKGICSGMQSYYSEWNRIEGLILQSLYVIRVWDNVYLIFKTPVYLNIFYCTNSTSENLFERHVSTAIYDNFILVLKRDRSNFLLFFFVYMYISQRPFILSHGASQWKHCGIVTQYDNTSPSQQHLFY